MDDVGQTLACLRYISRSSYHLARILLEGTAGLSRYMEIVLGSEFPQAKLLTPDKFIKYLKTMGIRLDKRRLEFYDKKGHLRPVLLYKEPVLKGPNAMRMISGPITIKIQAEIDKVEFLKDGDYQPWRNYGAGQDGKVILYYHPFQFVQAHRLEGQLNKVIKTMLIENLIEITQEQLAEWKKNLADDIDGWQKAMVDEWIPTVGLLMLLESPYAVDADKPVSYSPDDRQYFAKYTEWRRLKFVPRSILDAKDFDDEDIKMVYDHLATLGYFNDPLAHWYTLVELTKRSIRQKLYGRALLSQNYYELTKMTQYFARNLDVELLDADDYCNSDGGKWKPKIYGEPFDYRSSRTQMRIRDRFFKDRPYRVAIIFEGHSEEKAIRMILEALYIDEKRDGIILHNAKGRSNMEANLESLFDFTKKNDIDVFEIVDGEKASIEMLEVHKRKGIIKDGMSHSWKKDFEYDNFGTAKVVEKVNVFLRAKGHKKGITIEEVESRMLHNNSVLMNAISAITNSKFGMKLDNIVRKPELTEELMRDSIAKIRKERDKGEWMPELEIEKVMKKIFRMIPTNQ